MLGISAIAISIPLKENYKHKTLKVMLGSYLGNPLSIITMVSRQLRELTIPEFTCSQSPYGTFVNIAHNIVAHALTRSDDNVTL